LFNIQGKTCMIGIRENGCAQSMTKVNGVLAPVVDGHKASGSSICHEIFPEMNYVLFARRRSRGLWRKGLEKHVVG